MATLIERERKSNPNSLLIDCGDAIEGSPLEYVYQTLVRTGRAPLDLRVKVPLEGDPMMRAMNYLRYDAMAVGNHEFNFGLKNLAKARSDARFPWISANIAVSAGSRLPGFDPYVVKEVAGVKVAVVGIITPSVPTWEKLENVRGYHFLPAVESARKTICELRSRAHPDLVILAVHAGLGRDLKTGAARDPFENVVHDLAKTLPGVDAIVFGHSHQQLAEARVGNVLLTQPKNWDISLARVDFELKRSGVRWKVVSKGSRLIPVRDDTPEDPEVVKIARPYEELTERYLNSPVADAPRDLSAALGRVEDTALLDAVQDVQLHYTGADVSFASIFNPRALLRRGPITVRQIAALYVYDNQLYKIQGTGRMVKEALENAARYFESCQGQRCSEAPLINPRVFGFNYDIAEGVEYEIDLTRPEGDRIRNLRWKGHPLAEDQKLLIAVNNYRAAGSAGYSMFVGAPILWRSSEDIRDLMVRYYMERKKLPSEPDGNWRIVPDAARRTLERQAMQEVKHLNLF